MTREDRVQACMDLMRTLAWVRGSSAPKLAAEWGMAVNSVEDISAEASRRVKAEVTEPDVVTVDVCTALSRVMRDALAESYDPAMIDGGAGKDGERKVYQESPNVARRVVIDAAAKYAAIMVSKPTERHEHTITAMSPEQLEARKQEILAQIKASVVPMLEAKGSDDE